MKEITIVAGNEVGTLAQIAEALGSVGVNIEAISAYEKDNRAVFRVLTNDVTSAMKTLAKIPGVQASEADILVVTLSNKPGELGKATRRLANKSVNLESLYIVGKSRESTEIAVKPAPDHVTKAREALGLK
ncbi:MAG: hypothetical protein ACP5NX_04095 [Candidatus Bilamarchaeaceae archaeon]